MKPKIQRFYDVLFDKSYWAVYLDGRVMGRFSDWKAAVSAALGISRLLYGEQHPYRKILTLYSLFASQ